MSGGAGCNCGGNAKSVLRSELPKRTIINQFFVTNPAVGAHTVAAGTQNNLIIPVQIVIPWWGSWRTNNVLPIRNLNSQPRLDIFFQNNLKQCS